MNHMVVHQQFYQSLSICGDYSLIDPELTHGRQLEEQECVVEREQLPFVLHAIAILRSITAWAGWQEIAEDTTKYHLCRA